MLADGRIELRPGAALPVALPEPTDELHVGLMASEPATALRVHVGDEVFAPTAEGNRDGVPPWHVAVRLPRAVDELRLSLPHGGCLTYVGYRGGPDPAAAMRRPMGW